jgi:hypothetical protein
LLPCLYREKSLEDFPFLDASVEDTFFNPRLIVSSARFGHTKMFSPPNTEIERPDSKESGLLPPNGYCSVEPLSRELAEGGSMGKRQTYKTNLVEFFPMLETTSLAADDAGNRYLSATPSFALAILLQCKALHSLCFAKRPAAKNLVSAILFHWLSLRFLLVLIELSTCMEDVKFPMLCAKRDQWVELVGFWGEQETCHAAAIGSRHPLSKFFSPHSRVWAGRS